MVIEKKKGKISLLQCADSRRFGPKPYVSGHCSAICFSNFGGVILYLSPFIKVVSIFINLASSLNELLKW